MIVRHVESRAVQIPQHHLPVHRVIRAPQADHRDALPSRIARRVGAAGSGFRRFRDRPRRRSRRARLSAVAMPRPRFRARRRARARRERRRHGDASACAARESRNLGRDGVAGALGAKTNFVSFSAHLVTREPMSGKTARPVGCGARARRGGVGRITIRGLGA